MKKAPSFPTPKFFQVFFALLLTFIPAISSTTHVISSPLSQDEVDTQVASPAVVDQLLEPDTYLEGWLNVFWSDSFNSPSIPKYSLTTTSGNTYFLNLFITDNYKSPGIQSLSKYVRVQGIWQPDHSSFLVNQILETVPATSKDLSPKAHASSNWVIDGWKITGNTPWITVLCKFSDVPDEPKNLQFYQDTYGATYPGLDHYWREVSNNTINLAGSSVAGWYILPGTAVSYYTSTGDFDTTKAFQDCTTAADPYVDFSKYYGVNLMFNQLVGYYASGYGTCGQQLLENEYRDAGVTWTFPGAYGDRSILAHEMGHGYCFGHTMVKQGSSYVPYVDVWDIMGNDRYNCTYDPVIGCLPQQTIALNKYNLGWLNEPYVLTVQSPVNQTIYLDRSAQPATENFRMVRIVVDDSTYYTLETRQRIGYDQKLPGDAVIIHKLDNGLFFIDVDNDGDTADEDAMWKVGETYTDPDYPIAFTVLNQTATGFQIQLNIGQMPKFTDCLSQTFIPTSECVALVALYNNTSGPDWENHTGWLELSNPCHWYGVGCQGSHVVTLAVWPVLKGSIPPEIGNLSYLRTLYLASNTLIGEIPSTIGNLTSLNSLTLSGGLIGNIPASLGSLTNLWFLHLYGNHLEGTIPPELGNLTHLWELYLHDNQLSGSIPGEISSLNSLQKLTLSKNRLNGGIPESIGNLTGLQVLDLHGNQFSGEVPSTIMQLNQITYLDMNYNGFISTSPDVVNYLSSFDPNWMNTQTIPPTGLNGAPFPGGFTLSWSPIGYQTGTGHYEISYTKASEDFWKVHGNTVSKATASYSLLDLEPNTPYKFRIRTYTSSHFDNPNDLWSNYSTPILIDPSQYKFFFLPNITK